jgi:antirestriction protein ArdC
MSIKVYEIVTERILDYISANGVLPWRKPWHTSTPKNLVSKKAYRGVNVFLLGMQRFTSSYFVTYKQAAAKGGQVRKGEKSTPVIFWKMLDKGTDAKGRKQLIPLLRYYNVFNVTQCDGIVAPEEHTSTLFEPIEACERIVSGWEGKPPIVHGGGRACYSPSEDLISMPVRESFGKVEEYYSTLFHEMVHSTGHKDRLAREGITNPIKFASHNYSFEELVAECGAAFLCGHAGIVDHTIDNSAAYIANWVSKLKSEPKWIVDAAGKAAKASDLILGMSAKAEEEEDVSEEAA